MTGGDEKERSLKTEQISVEQLGATSNDAKEERSITEIDFRRRFDLATISVVYFESHEGNLQEMGTAVAPQSSKGEISKHDSP